MKIQAIISYFIIFIALVVACSDDEKSPTMPTTDDITFEWLSTSGNKIVDSHGNQVILHGVNRSGLEYDKNGNFMNQSEFDYMCQDWRADIIRVPFNQEWIMTDDAYNNFLDQVISWIKSNGAYVILDLQWQNTSVRIPPIPNTEAVEMWEILATRYKDDSAILYDIHNETHDVTFAEWRSRAIEIIDGIRSVHPKALILVSGMDWAGDVREWAQDPLPYDNIVYSVHVYPWMGEENVWNGNFGNYSDQIPMFIGEFGGYGENVTWGRALMAYLNKKMLGWTAWSWVDDPHLTQSNRSTPTEFGAIVEEMLYRHAEPDSFQNKISDIEVEYITSNRATVNWKTTNLSDSKLVYGLTDTYSDTIHAPVYLTVHTIKLLQLQPATTYHFKAISEDEFGFTDESSDSTFTTVSTR